MSAKSERAALSARLRELQLVLACISPAVIRATPGASGFSQGFTATASVELPGLSRRTLVVAKVFVTPVHAGGSWNTQSTGYEFKVVDEPTHRELFAYHWHPAGRSHLVEPHLHLGNALLAALGASRGIHFPTGQILFRDFIGMLIRECGARPLRRDGEGILGESPV